MFFRLYTELFQATSPGAYIANAPEIEGIIMIGEIEGDADKEKLERRLNEKERRLLNTSLRLN